MHPFQISPDHLRSFLTGALPVAKCIYIICSESFLAKTLLARRLHAAECLKRHLRAEWLRKLSTLEMLPLSHDIRHFCDNRKIETALHKKAFCKISEPTSDLWSVRTEPLPSLIPNAIHFVVGQGKPCFVIYTDGSRYPMKKKLCKGCHPPRKVQFFLTLFKRPLTPPPLYLNICPILQGVFFERVFEHLI